MVKADPVKDYYAELELPSTASTEDIKKQYRKLALQWHPDRNPGNEAEASIRFQAIGAAHEVLTDFDQRRRYDLTRKIPNSSATRPPRAADTPGNPWSDVSKQWEPPPKRGDPRYARSSRPPPPPRPANTANGGAARYRNFVNNPPPNTSQQDTRAHADRLNHAASAWQATRGGSAPTARKYNVPPPPPPPSAPQPPPPQYARPGAGSPENMSRQSSQDFAPGGWSRPPPTRQSSGRAGRGGYDPGSPRGEGDERPAPSSAYASYNRANPPRMNPGDLPPHSQPRRPSISGASSSGRRPSYSEDAFGHVPHRSRSGDDVPFAEGTRERTPYAGNAHGERVHFDSDALRRTASTRDAARMAAQPQAANEGRRTSFGQSGAASGSQKTSPIPIYSSDEGDISGEASPRAQSRRSRRTDDARSGRKAAVSEDKAGPDQATPQPAQTHTNGHPTPDAMDIDEPAPNKSPGGGTGNISMSDFRHVPPFTNESSGAGLTDLDDLKASLPFQSRPAPGHPLRTPDENLPSHLQNLAPPKPPVPPGSLNKDTWALYIQKMTAYFAAWNTFNAKVIAHFQDRAIQNQDRERGPAGGMVHDWIGAVGETEALGGWDSYVASVAEDESVRTRWNIACERHVSVIDRHTKLRLHVLESGILK